jgi:hypothetical protein
VDTATGTYPVWLLAALVGHVASWGDGHDHQLGGTLELSSYLLHMFCIYIYLCKLNDIKLNHTTLYYIKLNCIILYCIILYYIKLYIILYYYISSLSPIYTDILSMGWNETTGLQTRMSGCAGHAGLSHQASQEDGQSHQHLSSTLGRTLNLWGSSKHQRTHGRK